MLLVGLAGDSAQTQSCAIRALIFNMKRTIKVDPAKETGVKPMAIGDFFSMMGVDFDEAAKK